MRVNHFVATWEPGAVGGHVVAAQAALRDAGIGGDVYAGVVRDGLPITAYPVADYDRRARPGDVLCYEHAIGSTVADVVLARDEPLVVQYHNVTPHAFFDAWDRPLADALDWGRHQLRALARRSALGLADSHYNELELRAAGFAQTAVVPVFVDFERTSANIDAALRDTLLADKGGAGWLFVGRLAPNKAQHELVKAFALYRRTFDPGGRLWLIGGDTGSRYGQVLERFIRDAELLDAVQLVGPTGNEALGAYFDAADAFVCMSRHEGFGVPLLEAMAHGVPVVARTGTAVTETVADAGLLLEEDAPAIDVAAAVHRVVTDRALRDALTASGRRRAGEFAPARTRAVFLDALAPLTRSSAA
ncbi:MAG: glycosyltransferase [Actinomycetia bacterium]|nr:glycosyltransferase [Actinomycetes bacterium]